MSRLIIFGHPRVLLLSSTLVGAISSYPSKCCSSPSHWSCERNLEDIGKMLLDLSHSGFPNHGKQFSAAEITKKFRPTSDSVDVVREWLVKEGVHPARLRLSKSRG
ncbi:hypothetical protein BC835DRAFT_757547 [Cytidiella melzeri]|nr:hypothetical protein BC835DRAFT_757547 [Cytidiella melzeri]